MMHVAANDTTQFPCDAVDFLATVDIEDRLRKLLSGAPH